MWTKIKKTSEKEEKNFYIKKSVIILNQCNKNELLCASSEQSFAI